MMGLSGRDRNQHSSGLRTGEGRTRDKLASGHERPEPKVRAKSGIASIAGAKADVTQPVLRGRAFALCPDRLDVDLLRYRDSIIHLDAKVPYGALDLGVAKQKLDGPEIASAPIGQSSLGASERMRPK